MTSLPPLGAVLALLVLATALPDRVAARTVVLHPVAGSVLADGGGLVVGFTKDPGRRDVDVTLNGKTHRVRLWDGVFDIDLDWAKGDNTLQIADQEIKFRYDPYAETLREPSVHGAMLQNCGNCHLLGPDRDLALKDQTDALCLGCHGKKLSFAHPGATCRGCHEPHTSWRPALAKGEPDDLCLGCHRQRVLAEGIGHRGEWAGTGCTPCHRPHRPRPQDGGRECRRCHQDRAAAVPAHDAAVRGACPTCHEVHPPTPARSHRPPETACGGCHVGRADPDHQKPLQACGSCHGLHAARPVEAVGERCAPCHGAITAKSRLHGPDALGQCQECHPLHDLKNRSPAVFSCSGCHGMEKIAAGHTGAVLGFHTCVLCHRLHDSDAPFFLPPEQHEPFRAKQCAACHGEAGFGRDRKYRGAWGNLCRPCHEEIGSSHGPTREGGCNACHDPHGSRWKGLLKAESAATCRACHPTVTVAPETGAAHGKKVPCTRCHAPHGNGAPHHLKAAGNALCVGCHPDPTLELGGVLKPYVHGPLNLEGCGLCHRAHGDGADRHLVTPAAELCAGCHPEFAPAALARPGVSVHQPVREGRCGACHDPHAARHEALLRRPGNALCTGCHEGKRHRHPLAPVAGSRHATIPDAWPMDGNRLACRGCHAPHADPNPKLLLRGRPALCRECHRSL